MTPELYRRASDLFNELRDLPDSERQAAVDAACSSDPGLRAQVTRLLDADREAASGSFLERRAIEDAARILAGNSRGLPAPGTVIRSYRLDRRIGAGGMGVVYEAHDLRLHRRVAVKVLLPVDFAAEDKEQILRFQREARAASLLNHPGIVSIFDADLDQGWYFIAMEFVDGKTLRQMIASESRADGRTVLDLIGQAASALGAAHEAGIIHRDIKPENIMVRPDGFVKVLDFGLASVRESAAGGSSATDLRTRPGHLAGTIQYLSPEQILGEPAGPRSDLFSLGVVAWELATGKRPFDGPTDGAVFNAILNRMPAPPSAVRPSLGAELDGLIMRALEKDPELRFQTAGDLRSSCRRLTRDYIVRALESEREGGPQLPSDPAVLASPLPQAMAGAAPSSPSVPALPVRRKRPRLLMAAGLAVALVTALLWLTEPLPAPRVTGIVQITHDKLPKQFFVNDGARIYYAAGNMDQNVRMFQVNANGGEPVPMPRLTGMVPLDISPDRSELLLAQFVNADAKGHYPIWVADTLGSAPRRIGDVMADYARWSPYGDEILYCDGPELRIARADGSESRRLAALNGILQEPAWSPDGRLIRFTLLAKNSTALWEVAPDGSRLHALLPELSDHPHDGGAWTPDGNYFVFSLEGNTLDLWALRESRRFFRRGSSRPLRLTTGPLRADLPEASSEGHRFFFRGEMDLGELVRYDSKSDEWLPLLGGLQAMQLDYSRDGKWVTWASYPDASIWRSAADGGERLQLTTPPLFARNPRWSPDGLQVTFYGGIPGKPDRLYVVPAAGGAVRQLTHGESGPSGDEDGSWSPDSASLVFGAQSADRQNRPMLATIDVKTQRITRLPGSEGLWSPRWSPDGRYIAALDTEFNLCIYNMQTHARTKLARIGAGYPTWSRDGRYIYFEDNATSGWYRVGIKDRRMEHLASLKLKMAPETLGWIGLAPDGSLISTRDAGSTEIYALDWEAP